MLLCTRTEEEYCQASASRSVRPNRTPTPCPASMSILRLLDLSSAPFHRALNRCLDRLAKDLLPLSSWWFCALIFFRLQTLGIRVLKEPQPLQMQHRIKQTPFASTVGRRVIMLTVAPADVNHPPQLQERRHCQDAMETLPWHKLSRTTLKWQWIKWLWRKLRTSQTWCPVHLSQVHFVLTVSCILFFSVPENLGTRFLLRGVVLSRPKISNLECD
jgi:hypothetical protein